MIKHDEILNRTGWKHGYTLQEGDDWRVFKGKVIIVNSNNPVKIIHEDGTVEELKVLQAP